MIFRLERGIPKKYQTSPSTQARHKAKLYAMLDWIYRFGFTSPSVIEILLGLDRSVVNRLLRKYTREELLEEVKTFACRDRRVFLLKPKAVRMLEELHQQNLKYTIKASSLNHKQLTHDLMAAAVVAEGINTGKYSFFITEREQTSEGLSKARRFDALAFEVESNELIAIEIEASNKFPSYRLDILKRTREAILKDKKICRVLYYSHKRRFLIDAERVHEKLFANTDNNLDKAFFKKRLKIVYNKEITHLLYSKFWHNI
ncbi:hypothetical protein KO505_08865 [Psychrosphaera sp. F3M07]|uniref:helix-turn-helix domain-containing protein n=1 Tax=Psychrosphaera sp. F3M07 TaxID=2841560 RepID=UPI001C0A1990|nr:helix-turn-helix domain-containing protein [Psychrosphaera sp. F3M07]MBU2918071.1 hypothetical protein [Psychrosphaera sp. F3M07]